MDFTTAGASSIASFVSYALIKEVGNMKKEESVVIHAASGGVGTTAIQFAKALGAGTVIGAVGSEKKIETVLAAGVDHAITYDNFSDKVNQLTNGHGANLILDSVAGIISEKSLDCLVEFGRLVHFGNSSGEVANFKTKDLHASCRSILGFSLGTTRKHRPYLLKEIAEEVFKHLMNGDVNIKIGHEFALSDAQEAHRLMESRKHSGKIILNVSNHST